MGNPEITALQVAEYIILSSHESGSFLSNLKLQKLLYYVQAWHLAVFDVPMFPGRFEAWIHGPVIPDLYRRYKHYGWRGIDQDVRIDEVKLGKEDTDFIEEVLQEYGPMDARKLEIITHREDPWIAARGDLPMDQPCTSPIDERLMGAYYRSRLTEEELAEFRRLYPALSAATSGA